LNDSFGEQAESSAGTFDVNLQKQVQQTSSNLRDSHVVQSGVLQIQVIDNGIGVSVED
jgi:hypothetical protein